MASSSHRLDRFRTIVGSSARPLTTAASLGARFADEWARERLESHEERRLLEIVRAGRDVCWEPDATDEPLVTVLIPTYNRGQLLAERALASALAQSYERIEVLVVGDHCDEQTALAAMSTGDDRVRFVNLPTRGLYPSDPTERWMVAGSAPVNTGHLLARGSWVAPCDDDDELTPDHIEVLLEAALRQRAELVYSHARWEESPGSWKEIGGGGFRHGEVSHGAVLYSSGLRWMRFSNTSWKLLEPSDWNMWRRMAAIGVRIGYLDRVTYVHYVEAGKRLPQ